MPSFSFLSSLYRPDHHWKMNEGTGTTFADSVASIDGTLFAGATWGAGPWGSPATSFDGVDDYGEIADNSDWDLSGTNVGSFSLWMHGWTASKGLIGQSTTNGDFQWVCQTTGITNQVSVGLNGDVTLLDSAICRPVDWNHVVVTKDATTTRIYINGVQSASATGVHFNASSNVMRIGQYATLGGQHWDDLLDNFRWFLKTLTSSEVQRLYWAGRAP